MVDEESRVNKILKLLKKAESTTPAEAEAATELATKLMQKWAIDDAMLAAAGNALRQEEIIEKSVTLKGSYKQAHLNLAFTIVRSLKMQGIYSDSGKEYKMRFIGFESDVARAEMLFTSLLIQAQRGVNDYGKKIPSYYSAMEKFKARRAFLYGFADTIGSRLHSQHVEAVKEAQAAQPSTELSNSVALAVQSREQQAKAWYDQHYGRFVSTKRSRGISMGSNGGYSAGSAAGRSANVGAPSVGGGSKALGR